MDSIEIKSAKLTQANVGERPGTHIERQLNSRVDIGNAHKFFSPGAETHAAASLSPIAGTDSAALAALPGAKDPVSPLVQMIMRMPGHIGLVNSFFEALQAFFMPHSDLLSGFDPSILGAHGADMATGGFASGVEHGAIDPSILPAEAHIFDGTDIGLTSTLSPSHSWHMNLHNDGTHLFDNSLTVFDQPEVGNAIYEHSASNVAGIEKTGIDEQAGGMLAGPSISQSATGMHLAGSHPIFSKDLFDRAGAHSNGAVLASAPQNLAHTALPPATSQLVNQLSAPSVTNALYVSGSPLPQHLNATPDLASSGVNTGATNAAFSFVPRSGLNLSDQALSSQQAFGPSGAVSDNLGAKNILSGNDEIASNFHPSTLGNVSQADLANQQAINSPLKDAQSVSSQHHTALKGLQAKELALDGKVVPRLSNIHHSSAAHATSSHKAGLSSPDTNSKSSLIDSHKPSVAKPQHARQTTDDGKASAVSSEQDQVAINDKITQPTASDQTNLETGSHTVQAGDSLWKVAEEKLGDATRWPDIYKLNMDKIGANPDLIHPGLKLDLPEHAQDIATPTQANSEYIVKAGDNLWDISQNIYGNGSHWGQIYHLNSDTIGSDPRLIFPGEKLSIPSTDASTAVAHASGTSTATPINTGTHAGVHSAQLTNASHTDAPAPTQPATHQTSHTTTVASQPTSITATSPKVAFSGPGGADAKTLNELKPTTDDQPAVSPSLAPDLSFFTRKR